MSSHFVAAGHRRAHERASAYRLPLLLLALGLSGLALGGCANDALAPVLRPSSSIEAAETESVADADGDGIADDFDNCPLVSNSDQRDLDQDGIGDPCDPDDDNDGSVDDADNCRDVPNAGQTDTDQDGLGDACDADDDGDGFDDSVDLCPITPGSIDGCSPSVIIAGLLSEIESLPLSAGSIQSLQQKLQAAAEAIAQSNPAAAAGQLNAFINHLAALARSGRITMEVAASLTALAQQLIAQLSAQ